MEDLQGKLMLFNVPVDVHKAGSVGGDDVLRACLQCVLHFLLRHGRGDRFVFDGKGASKTAADIALLHLGQLQARYQANVGTQAGLPGQCLSDIEASISVVAKSGITPIPTYYTPMPHTALWPAAVASSRYDLESDPVFTNNALLPCTKAPFSTP